jgi:plastocyanin
VLRHAGSIAIAVALASSSCIFGGGAQTRVVLVDYSSDQFASSYLGFFPRHVQVHPGDTVVFKQTWTGEPHTVTGGTLVDPLEKAIASYIPKYDKGGFNAMGVSDEPKNVRDAAAVLPTLTDEKTRQVAQNGAQSCYLDSGAPPRTPQTPCTKQPQPAFSGRQSFYSSGYIHYAGPSGNVFRMPIANAGTWSGDHFWSSGLIDTGNGNNIYVQYTMRFAKPGTYRYACLVHPAMVADITITP